MEKKHGRGINDQRLCHLAWVISIGCLSLHRKDKTERVGLEDKCLLPLIRAAHSGQRNAWKTPEEKEIDRETNVLYFVLGFGIIFLYHGKTYETYSGGTIMTRIGISSPTKECSLGESEESGSSRNTSSTQDADDWIRRCSRQRAEVSLC